MNRDTTKVELADGTLHAGIQRLSTKLGPFDLHLFRDLARSRTAMALVRGDPGGGAPLLARVHSSCVTSECLGARDCDCAEQLEDALATIARAGRGVLFYLMQEGRGAGLAAKARDRMIVQASGHRVTTFEAYAAMGLPADLRSYEELAPMTRMLGIRAPLRLLTNNPEKAEAVASALVDEKIEVVGTRPIQRPDSPFNRDYLNAKQRSGHALDPTGQQPGILAPETVEVEPPCPAIDAPHLVSMARYLLPVGLPVESRSAEARAYTSVSHEADWFGLRVVFDRRTARESIVLSRSLREKSGASGQTHQAGEVEGDPGHTMYLNDRLPIVVSRGRRLLGDRLRAIRARGEGAVVIDFDESRVDSNSRGGFEREARRIVAAEILSATWTGPEGGSDGSDVGD